METRMKPIALLALVAIATFASDNTNLAFESLVITNLTLGTNGEVIWKPGN